MRLCGKSPGINGAGFSCRVYTNRCSRVFTCVIFAVDADKHPSPLLLLSWVIFAEAFLLQSLVPTVRFFAVAAVPGTFRLYSSLFLMCVYTHQLEVFYHFVAVV